MPPYSGNSNLLVGSWDWAAGMPKSAAKAAPAINWDALPKDADRVHFMDGSSLSRPKPVVLTLTQAEAETLRVVCALIGGKSTGRRGDTDSINSKLDASGVKGHSGMIRQDGIAAGSIIFPNTREGRL